MINKPTILIVAYRAFGDTIFALPIIEHIRATYPQYHIHAELNLKAYHILENHPAIDSISIYEPDTGEPDTRWARARERWDNIAKELKPDMVFNLQNTIERSCIATEEMPEFWLSTEERHEKFGKTNFYLSHFDKFGMTPPPSTFMGNLGKMHFTEQEESWAKKWRSQHKDSLIVIIPMAGSTSQKMLPHLEPLSRWITDTYCNSIVYLAGSLIDKAAVWMGERIVDTCGASFRQLSLMAKYADLVMGPETGLMAAAGMWGTPKIYMATSSSLKQLSYLTENDFSFQSSTKCAPCYRSCYTAEYCPETVNGLPACVVGFDVGDIQKAIHKVFINHGFNVRNEDFDYVKAKQVIDKWKPFAIPCPICGKYNNKFFDLWAMCSECGIVYQNPDNLDNNAYTGAYVGLYDGVKDRFIKAAEQYFPMVEGKEFFEIGPANTAIMEYAKEEGWTAEAIDIAPIQSPNGFKIYRGSFEDFYIGKQYDFIWASHVFEHFKRPQDAVHKVYKMLNDNGYAFIAMPDISLIEADNIENWGHWKRKEHNAMFSLASFRRLCQEIGFTVVYEQQNEGATNFICNNDFHIVLQKIVGEATPPGVSPLSEAGPLFGLPYYQEAGVSL